MTIATDTPLTDAVQFQPRPISLTIESEMLRALSRKLERELAASKAEVERLRSALELIAAPKRPDGTYNRCREACEKLASKALKPS
jgi:predicted nucleic acid-binding protein